MIAQLDADDRAIVIETISDDLKTTDDETVIRHVMSGTPAEIWSDVSDIARLRFENKIIRSIRDGKYDTRTRRCLAGALATWARPQFSRFLLKKELLVAVATKLSASDSQERDYALQYRTDDLFSSLELFDLGPIHRVYVQKLKEGEETFYDDLMLIPEEKWSSQMKSAYTNFSAKH